MSKYLRKCLDSVIEQTLTDIEIICINDGSNDGTDIVLNKYERIDKRVNVINQANHGVAFARNQGIKQAKGRYLYFIDPDDWIPDNSVLEDLYTAAVKNEALICGGSFEEVNVETGLITNWTDKNNQYVFKRNGWIDYSQYQFDYGWVRFIYNREFLIINDILMPNRIFYEDPVFFVKAMSAAGRFYALKRVSYCYRTGHHSYELSYDKAVNLVEGIIDIVKIAQSKNYKKLINLEIDRLTDEYALRLAQFINLPKSEKLRLELNRLNSLVNTPQDVRIECMILQKEYTRLQSELQELQCSYNWKVGQFVLFIPKKIYYWAKHIFHS